MHLRGFLVLCCVLHAASVDASERVLKGDFSGWYCNNGIIYTSAGAVASASGSYDGGPWIWLGGNSCQASAQAEAVAGTDNSNGAFAAADTQAFSSGRKLLWGNWHGGGGGAAAASSASAASGDNCRDCDGDDGAAAASSSAAASGDDAAAASSSAAAAGG